MSIQSQYNPKTDKNNSTGIKRNVERTADNNDTKQDKDESKRDYANALYKWVCSDIKITDLALVYFTYCLVIVGWFTMKGGERATRQLESAIIHSVIDENNLQELLKFSLFYNNSPSMDDGTVNVVRGQSSIWFYGRIIYDDIFGIEHEHRFCWFYHGGSYGFRPYYKDTEYNKNT